MNKSKLCQQIVERYKAGELEAINELPPVIDGMIYSIIKRYGKNYDKEELYQVSWQAIMTSLTTYDVSRETLFITYVYNSIKWAIMNYIKSEKKHKTEYDEENNCIKVVVSIDKPINLAHTDSICIEDIISGEDNVERQVIKELMTSKVFESFKDYPPKQKQILEMYFNGVPQYIIANELDITYAYVSKTIRLYFENGVSKLDK